MENKSINCRRAFAWRSLTASIVETVLARSWRSGRGCLWKRAALGLVELDPLSERRRQVHRHVFPLSVRGVFDTARRGTCSGCAGGRPRRGQRAEVREKRAAYGESTQLRAQASWGGNVPLVTRTSEVTRPRSGDCRDVGSGSEQ
jgi:hypothetical protein